jgi:hypothetical protein
MYELLSLYTFVNMYCYRCIRNELKQVSYLRYAQRYRFSEVRTYNLNVVEPFPLFLLERFIYKDFTYQHYNFTGDAFF